MTIGRFNLAFFQRKDVELLNFEQYRWYEIVILLPVILVAIQGGLIGTGLGLVSLEAALKCLRSDHSMWLRILAAVGISLIFLAVYGVIFYFVVEWAQTALSSI